MEGEERFTVREKLSFKFHFFYVLQILKNVAVWNINVNFWLLEHKNVDVLENFTKHQIENLPANLINKVTKNSWLIE